MNALHAWRSTSFFTLVFVNAASFMSFRIYGMSNKLSFILALDKARNWIWGIRSINLSCPTLKQITSLFNVLCAREVIKCFACHLNWHGKHFWIPEPNLIWASLSLSSLCPLLYYHIRIGNLETLCILLVDPITFQASLYRRINTICVYGLCSFQTPIFSYRMFPWDGLSVLRYWRYILPLRGNPACKFLLEHSINKH